MTVKPKLTLTGNDLALAQFACAHAINWVKKQGPYAFGTVRFRLPKRRPDIHPPIGDNATLREITEAVGGSVDYLGDGIHWVICGAESGPGARPMDLAWARTLKDESAAVGVAFFMKQISGPNGRAIKDMAQFPPDLQIRQFPTERTTHA